MPQKNLSHTTIEKLEDLQDELQDSIDELGRAFEPIPGILREVKDLTGDTIGTRQTFAWLENFLGIMGWTGCGDTAEDLQNELQEVIEALRWAVEHPETE